MQEGRPYRNVPIESDSNREAQERQPHIPVINIVRHGETEYRELTNPDLTFDPTQESFALTPEHLDLTKEGINSIRETAEQLEKEIDKEREVVLIVTSPNFRAHSSALLIEEYLRAHGVELLNEPSEIRYTRNLGQSKIKDKSILPEWMRADKAYRQESEENTRKSPEVAHKEIAKRLGLELDDVFAETHQDMDLRFNRFLRHMTNIYDWLTPETKTKLGDKQLRIVCVTHEEIPRQFLSESLGLEDTLRKGQMVEIVSTEPLRAGAEVKTSVTLYPKGPSDAQEGKILRSFNPEEDTTP